MSNFVPGSYYIQEAMQACAWLVFAGLAIASHTAQSEQLSFANTKNIVSNKLVAREAGWKPSYLLNTQVALNRSEDNATTGLGVSTTPQMLLVENPKKQNDWSINIQNKIHSGSDCSSLSTLICFESKEERPADIKPLRESFWIVWRKALHF